MVARKVRMKLKPHSALRFSRIYDRHVLPVLREQPGFRDGMTLVSGEREEAVAISFWEKREDAEAFARAVYPVLVDELAPVLAEAPEVSAMVLSNSTSHGVVVRQ